MTDAAAVSEAITQRVRTLSYDDNTFPAFPGSVPTMVMFAATPLAAQAEFATLMSSVVTIAGITSSLTDAGSPKRAPESIEWTVRVCCKQSDLYETSSILLFIGDIPTDGSTCISDDCFAGSYDPFVNPYPRGCRNCVENVDIVLEGFVHITDNLISQGIDVMDASSVEEHLKEKLKWVVWTHAGEYERVEDLKSLEVTAIDTPIYGPEGADIPVICGVRKHNEVTFDKPGGRVRVPGYPSAHS
ncbi:hypothetical protein FRC01_000193 [Tulasnella sp. 417]|nr:hypothetical protein FRC01_000193 [Tulasnella sp. 417]